MFFLTPRYVKYGRNFVKDARKLLAYKRDLWSEATIADFEAGISRLEAAVKARDEKETERAAQALDAQCANYVQRPKDAGWRENCEVFLVAIVVALGVRTYFLQPFTIPTGSMQPTLNGILGTKTQEPPPNIVTQIVQYVLWGRTWVNVVARTDDVIIDLREVKKFGILTRTELVGKRSSYVVDCPIDTLSRYLLPPMQPFKAGDVIARGYYETGDHVFVDKMTYHFRRPQRDEVFVFNTHNIPTRENRSTNMQGPSQYYIKRLAGIPGDVLQVRPPELLHDGKRAQGFGFERVMSEKDGYRGYTNTSEQLSMNGQSMFFRMNLLGAPEEKVQLEEKQYFAMGDNSYHSSDSRDWGTVPQENIMGRGVFVYWPFTRHTGLIR